ncbi:MAG: type II secretion system protein [Phycisphaerae bacterium]|nr:type II secretion system protein [Phycisphaerae bacterium]
MRPSRPRGFTLIELLVVIAIVALLVGILLPSLSAAREMMRHAQVRVELDGLGKALRMYEIDLDQGLPPARASCNPDMIGHENQLPVELAEAGYVRRSDDPRRMADAEDPFNREHSYKYTAPGGMVVNNTLMPEASYVWVPHAFPNGETLDGPLDTTDDGALYNRRNDSPIRWVLWSTGPDPNAEKVLSSRAPVSRRCWYRRTGDSGVIALIESENEQWVLSP